MNLREGEQIMKVFHHHPTPYFFNVFKFILGFLPFFFLLFMLQDVFSVLIFYIINLAILFLFTFIVLYYSLVYWLDKMIITNERAIYINWKTLFKRTESEAYLEDIEDIQTSEKGILSYFWLLDYGYFSLATGATKITIVFDQAPDPEGIRQFIYHVRPSI